MSERLEDKMVEFRQYLALGHVNMDILNQASEIHELVIKQAERVQELEEKLIEAKDDYDYLSYHYGNETEQNKRYREVLNRISITTKEGTTYRWAQRALEGEK